MNSINQDWTRRKFIATVTGAGTPMALNPFTSWANNELDPKIKSVVAKAIGIDTHNHIDVPFNPEIFKVKNMT